MAYSHMVYFILLFLGDDRIIVRRRSLRPGHRRRAGAHADPEGDVLRFPHSGVTAFTTVAAIPQLGCLVFKTLRSAASSWRLQAAVRNPPPPSLRSEGS
jgi:hypothetical protein